MQVAGSQSDSFIGAHLKGHFDASADGAKRMAAAGKGLVTVADSSSSSAAAAAAAAHKKKISVAFRATPAGGESVDAGVPALSADECVELCARIMARSNGGKRRLRSLASSNSGPSTALLKAETIAARSPALFWSLYENSRADRSEAGDVNFALDHVRDLAIAKFKEIVAAM